MIYVVGKEEKDCMFEQTGLGLFVFDENRLIAVHDYERSFPAVLDIYKFWWFQLQNRFLQICMHENENA